MRNPVTMRALRLSVFALWMMMMPSSLQAQGVLIPRDEVRDQPFSVKSLRVDSVINDSLVETTVEQTFVNHSRVQQEGTYLFPLPDGASITSLSLRAGDRVLEGKLMTRAEARAIYESIVRRRKDPALLEYVGRGLFRASVFPIPPRSERTLTLRYVEMLKLEGGLTRFSYPLSTGRFSSRPLETMSVMARLKTTTPLKTVYSPSHDVSVRRMDDYNATASWEGRGEFPDRDFLLYYATSVSDVGLSLLTYQSVDKDGFFLLIASPRFSVPKERILPRQVVFVLDRTGSMQANKKMEQARNALQFCLDKLHPHDRFNVITFNESPDILFQTLVPANAENIRKAHAFVQQVEASGGTNINEALLSALSLLKKEEGSQKTIIFLTDGLPTVGETNTENILNNVRRLNDPGRLVSAKQEGATNAAGVGARLFCFGVGYDVNVPFLDRLAEETRAEADYVRPEESIEGIVSAFYAKISSPILTNLQLSFDSVQTYDIYPKVMPDLFQGGQIIVTGRYRGSGSGGVRLAGQLQNQAAVYRLDRAFGENAARSPLVPRIWATRKIGYLLDQVRLHSNQEVIDEIIRLSKEFGIVTPYTSYLADERQDLTLHETTAPGSPRGSSVYRIDAGAIERLHVQAKEELFRIGGRDREGSGSSEAHRSLNAKGYQQANRAPTNAQGGFRSGGASGFGGGIGGRARDSGDALGKETRAGLSLDFGKATDERLLQAYGENKPGYRQIAEAARVQAVGGRVFYRRKNIWFDNEYQSGQRVVKVRALSDAYFQLLRARPELSRYAAVGEEVVLNLGKVAVQFGREGKETLSSSELNEIVQSR
jgi:Ca-activated chloride channel family protein